MAWTEYQVELLRQMWRDGRSASQISAVLACGLTRNAVIGKVHRLGLAARAKATSEERVSRSIRADLGRAPSAVCVSPSLRQTEAEWIAAGFTAEDRAEALAAEDKRRAARIAMRARGGHALSPADRAPVVTVSPPRVERSAETVHALAEMAQTVAKALVAPASLNLTFFELGDGQCRYIGVGELYCGSPSEFKSSYCRFHSKIVYQVPPGSKAVGQALVGAASFLTRNHEGFIQCLKRPME